MKIPEKISEEIIYRLDSIARGRCNYEYGLPTIPDCEEMKEMKKAIEEILKPYLKSEWKNAFEVYPERNQKVIAKSPDGTTYITTWRPSYQIFSCMCKDDSIYDWEWKEID